MCFCVCQELPSGLTAPAHLQRSDKIIFVPEQNNDVCIYYYCMRDHCKQFCCRFAMSDSDWLGNARNWYWAIGCGCRKGGEKCLCEIRRYIYIYIQLYVCLYVYICRQCVEVNTVSWTTTPLTLPFACSLCCSTFALTFTHTSSPSLSR